MEATRIDHVAGGIYRISTWVPQYRLTFNQFLIDDDRPALIHTGEYAFYEQVRSRRRAGARPRQARGRGAPALGG